MDGATGRNIVICFDGTGNEYQASGQTNVLKLYRALDRRDPEQQVALYLPGVGTMAAPGSQTWITRNLSRLFGLAFGYGVFRSVMDAYAFVMKFYRGPDDRIFLFGFSRGAYAARVLAGMLQSCGLLDRGAESLIPYALRVYRKRLAIRPAWAHGWRVPIYHLLRPIRRLKGLTEPDWKQADGFKQCFSRKCHPHFIGIWDTVKSIGWFRRSVILPHTAYHPALKYGRHAVAIDERRRHFRTNLWKLAHWREVKDADVRELWFAGVHSDVGGSYADSRLSDIALQWVLDGAEQYGLKIWPDALPRLKINPDPGGPMHNSLRGFWRLLGGYTRQIPEDAVIHRSVEERMRIATSADADFKYEPNIPASATFEE